MNYQKQRQFRMRGLKTLPKLWTTLPLRIFKPSLDRLRKLNAGKGSYMSHAGMELWLANLQRMDARFRRIGARWDEAEQTGERVSSQGIGRRWRRRCRLLRAYGSSFCLNGRDDPIWGSNGWKRQNWKERERLTGYGPFYVLDDRVCRLQCWELGSCQRLPHSWQTISKLQNISMNSQTDCRNLFGELVLASPSSSSSHKLGTMVEWFVHLKLAHYIHDYMHVAFLCTLAMVDCEKLWGNYL